MNYTHKSINMEEFMHQATLLHNAISDLLNDPAHIEMQKRVEEELKKLNKNEG